MQDVDIIEQCKRKAKQIKRDYPDKGYMQRLDVDPAVIRRAFELAL